jgi:Spy/CpxP family protein refolding chaperone
MKSLQDVRSSIAFIGAVWFAVSLAACAGGGGAQSNQSTLPSVAQAGADRAGALSQWGYGHHHFGFGRMLRGLNLSDQQRARIHQLLEQHRQAHYRGGGFNLQAHQQLHQQILAILTPQQRAMLKQNMEKLHQGRKLWLSLSDKQRTQIRQLVRQYRQAHPRGSGFDPQAHRQLHQAILAVLTPQQRVQLKQSF